MQAIGVIMKSVRLARVSNKFSPSICNSVERLNSHLFVEELATEYACKISFSHEPRRRFHTSAQFSVAGNIHRYFSQIGLNQQINGMQIPLSLMVMPNRSLSSEARETVNDSTDAETVKGVYDKILNSVAEKRTAPPNAWLWLLVAKCSTEEDIKLLFYILQKLRTFRLSNLRIAEDFNPALCREVMKACVRAGAIDFGLKTLWKHNLYGLTPEIGSAHHLLLYAKQRNDLKLMHEVMKLVKKSNLPLQPGTADIVLSICYSLDRWDLISKYGKRFVKSGVRLRQTAFDLWMEFAAKKGDIESLWKIEQWRSEAMKQHSVSTGFSCAKGLLLEHNPESAAATIQVLYQTVPDSRRPSIVVELQKLVREWPLDVVRHQNKNKEAFATALDNDISALIDALTSLGVNASVSMQDFSGKEAILS